MSRTSIMDATAAATTTATVATTMAATTSMAAGSGTEDDDDEGPDAAEVVAISERIRAALECPICLLLNTEPMCRCPNGHVICYGCMVKLRDMDATRRCPMCRSPMASAPHLWCTATALSEFMGRIKVTCSYRPYGCDDLVPVTAVPNHESSCAYMPDARCQVFTCDWVGEYDGLFQHVSSTHPTYAVTSATNSLIVNDAKDLVYNRRRSYLVKTPHGLFWVLLAMETRNRIRGSVLMVPDNDDSAPRQGPVGMVYRISWGDEEARLTSKRRTRRMGWSSSPKHYKVPETYTMVRCRPGPLHFVWFNRHPAGRRAHPSNAPAVEVVASGSQNV